MKNDIVEIANKVIANTYSRFPIVIKKGKGCVVEDINGKEYIDFIAGIAVCNLGHAHPEVQSALSDQAGTLLHVSNLYYTIPQVELASWLVKNSFADRVFFCNSGAEANEAAIKLARKNFTDRGENNRFRIVTMENSFHGRTMAAMSATGQEKVRAGYEPVLVGFDFVPFNDLEELKKAVKEDVCAVMLEPIQGEGGLVVPDTDFLKEVRKICDATGTLLIFDEIQTGIGRTGKLFAYEHFGVTPDIMTLAKALGNGMPIGAMLASERVAESFSPGSHASTFGGTPVITAASLATLKVMERDNIVEQGRETGDYFKKKLLSLKGKYEVIEDVLGMGLLLGIKLKEPGSGMVAACMENGFLINCIQENILRFAPPLIVKTEEIDALIDCLDELLGKK